MQPPEYDLTEQERAESLFLTQQRTGVYPPEWERARGVRLGHGMFTAPPAPRKGGTIQPKARKKGKKR